MIKNRPRVIILEGPDGGGKTHLAKQLAQEGYATRHTGPPTPGVVPYMQYTASLAQVVVFNRTKLDQRPYVFDRLHVGERVYGPVVRDVDKLGPVLHRQLDRILLGINGVVVYCATDYETMEATWRERATKGEELITDSSRYQALFTRYEEVIAKSPLTFRFDYKRNTLEDVLNISPHWWNPGPGIGAWRKGYSTLLVGERIAESLHGVDWPFTGLHGSSVWLSTKLEEAGIKEQHLYWANAFTPDTEPQDPSFIEQLQPKRIIALGVQAKQWLKKAGYEESLDFVTVDHPQYWKRFRHNEPYPLIEMLSNDD